MCVEKPGRRKGSCSGTTIGKLVTQQVGDELQLQENEINITIILCPKYHVKQTLKRDLSNEDFDVLYRQNPHTNECILSDPLPTKS